MNVLGLTPDEVAVAERIDAVTIEHLLPIAHRFGERHEICRELLETMADHGFLGLNIAAEYGGAGGDHRYSTLLCILREHLGYHDPGVDFTFGLQGLGTVAIVRHGTDDQRAEFLPDLVAGKRVYAFAVTEPQAGSDVRGMTTTAIRDGDVYRVTGTKTYISGAPDADVVVLVTRTGEANGRPSYTAFLLDPTADGVTVKTDIELAAPHSIGTILLDDVVIPVDRLIGVEGEGLKVALGTLEVYRPSVGALAVGMTQRAFDLALDVATNRAVSRGRLSELEAIRLKLARMWADATIGRGLVYRAAALRDAQQSSVREAAIAKLFATEAACRAIYESQQIHGARGVTVGQPIESLARHARQATIYEGTSEIQRSIIARADLAAEPAAPAGDALDVVRSAIDRFRRLPIGERLLAGQAASFRLADVSIALDAATLMAEHGRMLDAEGDPDADRVRCVADIAMTEAVDVATTMLLDMRRRGGPDAVPDADLAAIAAIEVGSVDERLLDLAGLLW